LKEKADAAEGAKLIADAAEDAKLAAVAAEGGKLTAVAPTPFGMFSPNTAVNNTDRALAEDGPSIEESKKEDDDINWAIEDAKKATSDPKETGGTIDKQNSKTVKGIEK
jgi:hypothetical protein